MLMLPLLFNGAEAWTLLITDAALRVFERKLLLKIYCPVRVGDGLHNRSNNKLYERANIQQMHLLAHIIGMKQEFTEVEGTLRLCLRLKDQVEEDLSFISVWPTVEGVTEAEGCPLIGFLLFKPVFCTWFIVSLIVPKCLHCALKSLQNFCCTKCRLPLLRVYGIRNSKISFEDIEIFLRNW